MSPSHDQVAEAGVRQPGAHVAANPCAALQADTRSRMPMVNHEATDGARLLRDSPTQHAHRSGTASGTRARRGKPAVQRIGAQLGQESGRQVHAAARVSQRDRNRRRDVADACQRDRCRARYRVDARAVRGEHDHVVAARASAALQRGAVWRRRAELCAVVRDTAERHPVDACSCARTHVHHENEEPDTRAAKQNASHPATITGSHERVGFVQDAQPAGNDAADMTTSNAQTFDELRATVTGDLVLPDDAAYDGARASWNLSVDQRPAAVLNAASVQDVQALLRFVAGAGLRVAPQSTGHGSEALGDLGDAVLLKTSALRDIAVDPATGVARVGAGVQAGELADAAARHGLAPVLGLAPSVGVAGLVLGGGTGWLSRRHGLAANNVRALEVVTVDGQQRRIDAQHEADLFWAMRGSGGRAAIVTALELEAHPVPEVCAGMLVWPAGHAAEVLERYRCWAADLPESVGAVFRYLSLPDVEAVPAPLRGKRIVAVVAAVFAGEPDARRLLEPLRNAGGKLLDTFGPIGPADLVRVAGDPEQPGPARGDGFLLDDLTPDLADSICALIADDALAPLSVLELRLLGGALGRASEGHGVLASLRGKFSVFAGGVAPDDTARAAVTARHDDLRARLAPWIAPQPLLTSARLGSADLTAAFDDTERLRDVVATFDPERRILSGHDAA
jgi:hypothetical protein